MPGISRCAGICDDFGYCVNLAGPARRIVPLYGAFNDMLLALGAGESIVARTAADSEPPEIAKLPSIGTHMRPNSELILAARPDVILQIKGRDEANLLTGRLRDLGLNALCFEIDSFEQLFKTVEKLGVLTGREARAAELVANWRERLAKIEKTPQRPKVYYEIREPDLLAAGGKGIVNAIIDAAGGENAVNSSKKLARYNGEALLLANPDFCLIQKGPMNPAPRPLAQRPDLAGLRCAETGKNIIVDERFFARPGPDSIKAAEELAKFLSGPRKAKDQ